MNEQEYNQNGQNAYGEYAAQNGYNGYSAPPQINPEKRYLRSIGTYIGVAAIILAVVSRLWSDAVILLFKALGISQSFIARLFTDAGFQQLEQVLFSTVCFTVPFIIAARAANERVANLVPFKKPKEKTALPYLFIGLGFCAFANYSVNVAGSFFESFGVNYEVTRAELPTGSLGILIYVIATALVPAIVEEFACRGVILGLLKPFGEGFAVVSSAVLFGIIHGNFEQIPFAFLVGLVLALVRVKTDSIFICMVIHFINNFVSLTVNYLSLYGGVSEDAVNICYVLYMVICLALGIIGVLLTKNEQSTEFKTPVCEARPKQKYIWFFTSPAIIVFVVLELLNSVRYFIV